MPSAQPDRLERALLSLDGLSLGDALGERFFGPSVDALRRIAVRELPPGVWGFTDDTAMALGIVETLSTHGRIEPNALATSFASRFTRDPHRGYGAGAFQLLGQIARGIPWRIASRALFDGQGSKGNGAAMRVAPLGAFFADDLDRVVDEARASAQVTHGHPDGQAGAIAVAVAAAVVGSDPNAGAESVLLQVAARTPASDTREGIEKALALTRRWAKDGEPASAAEQAAALLGNGSRVQSSDTVPFALWCAARHLGSFEDAFWSCVSALGDRDTTCAICGGIVALSVGREGLPRAWLERREPLPIASG